MQCFSTSSSAQLPSWLMSCVNSSAPVSSPTLSSSFSYYAWTSGLSKISQVCLFTKFQNLLKLKYLNGATKKKEKRWRQWKRNKMKRSRFKVSKAFTWISVYCKILGFFNLFVPFWFIQFNLFSQSLWNLLVDWM